MGEYSKLFFDISGTDGENELGIKHMLKTNAKNFFRDPTTDERVMSEYKFDKVYDSRKFVEGQQCVLYGIPWNGRFIRDITTKNVILILRNGNGNVVCINYDCCSICQSTDDNIYFLTKCCCGPTCYNCMGGLFKAHQ
jgi:hypothetical protein